MPATQQVNLPTKQISIRAVKLAKINRDLVRSKKNMYDSTGLDRLLEEA